MPFDLPEHARKAFSSRLMLQLPGDVPPRELARVRREMDKVVMGMPGDVFMSLDALRLLADQGNKIAQHMFELECRRLGLTERFYSFPKA